MSAVLESSINWIINGEAVNSTNINRPLKEFNGALGTIATKNTITSSELSDNAVTSAKIDDNAVTTIKLANDSVTTDKIQNSAITSDKIANDAITADKIQNGAITSDKLSSSAIITTIADGSISIEKIKESVDIDHDPTKFLNEQGQFISLPPGVSYTAGAGLTLTSSQFSVNVGTSAETIAAGDDSRIINGQIAYTWGDHSTMGYLTAATVQSGQTYTAGTGLSLSNSNQFSVNIVNNLTTDNSSYVLSAAQGKVLKSGIDGMISGSSLKMDDSDWLLITYDWSAFDGTDLDTRASFYGAQANSNTKLALTNGALYLGYGGGGNTIESTATPSTPYNVGQFGGDVVSPSTGTEHVLINLKGMRTDTTYKTFKVDIEAKWWMSSVTGYDSNVVVSIRKIIGPGNPNFDSLLKRWSPNPNQYLSVERAVIKKVTDFQNSSGGSFTDICTLVFDVNKNIIMFAEL